MATYKVWLTVKDSYGNTKEVDGGTLDISLAENLTTEEITQITEVLPLDSYLKKSEIDFLATDAEVETVIKQNNSIKYSEIVLRDED